MTTQVKTWGNSQGIRLSKDTLETAGIRLNEYLDVEVSDGKLILSKKFIHKTLEERALEYNGELNLDGEFDKGEAMGRGVW